MCVPVCTNTVHICFMVFSGFSGVTVNFMPWPVVWLCNADRSKQLEEKRAQVQQLLSLTDRTIANKVGLHFGLGQMLCKY